MKSRKVVHTLLCVACAAALSHGQALVAAPMAGSATEGAQAAVQSVSEPQTRDDIFAGIDKFAAKAKESNEVTMDKNTLGLAARKSGQVGELARKADLVLIRNYEYANEGDYKMSDLEEYLRKLNGDGWQHLVRNRSAREINDIAVRYDKDGQTKETVIINAEPKELNIIHIVGPLSVKDMGKLRRDMNSRDDADVPATKGR